MTERIELSQGAGGRATEEFIKEHILPHFYQPETEVPLAALDDAAVVGGIVFTTDSHTVQPLEFPGGDIGTLAVAGTINDLAVMGAQPLALAAGMVIEEGLQLEEFDRLMAHMGSLSREAQVPIVTGDTKVVERGGVQGMIITTTGIGTAHPSLDSNLEVAGRGGHWLQDDALRPGDKLLLSGTIADHGIAVLSCREGYGFGTRVTSDVAPLHTLIQACLKVGGVVAAKDPTRGGVANTLNEMASKSQVGMLIYEEQVPIQEGTLAACEMLGINPFAVGNEGKVVLGVVPEKAEEVLQTMHSHPLGREAAIIGEVTEGHRVLMETSVGGRRIVEAPVGDPIPRIC